MISAQEMLGESGPKAPRDACRSKRLPGTQGQPGPSAEHGVGSSRRDWGDKGAVTMSVHCWANLGASAAGREHPL